MILESIYLSHFRNYEKAHVAFGDSVNLIIGENGQGKTNLLEALYFLSTGRSFRTQQLSDMIFTGEPFFYLELHFTKDRTAQTLKASFDGQTKKIFHNGTLYSSFSSVLGLLPMVMITPQDLWLVSGPPSDRRRFLDLHLAQSDPLYVHHLSRYIRAVKQRNALLRTQDPSIEAWEKSMAASASYILQRREEALLKLTRLATTYLHLLTENKEQLHLRYSATLVGRTPETIFAEFQRSRKKESFLGQTILGPHRDDILFSINGTSAKNFASEGQKRSLVIALRLAQWESLKESSGYPPLLGIDDFGIHLDARRYAQIQNQLRACGQVFLTSPTSPSETVSPTQHTIFISEETTRTT